MSRNTLGDSFASRILWTLSQKAFWGILRPARSMRARYLFSVLGLLFLLSCTAKQGTTGGSSAECGECLDMPTGEVCTVNGTRRNSCMAICENAKILCFEACPCPEEK